MKSMHIELQYTTATIPPIHEGICASSELDREIIIGDQSVDGIAEDRPVLEETGPFFIDRIQ